MSKNIFEKIRDKEEYAEIIYKNQYVTAFKDIDPSAPHHIIIIPNRKISTVNDIKDDDALMMGHLFLAARDISKELDISEKGYRLIINCNKDGGQEVFYIHMHLVGGCPLGKILKLPKESKKIMNGVKN